MQLNRIYHEDCLVGLKQITTESIDLVVTDCPYKIEAGGVSIEQRKDEMGGVLSKRTDSHGNAYEKAGSKHISLCGILNDKQTIVRSNCKIGEKWVRVDGAVPSAVRNGKMFEHNDIEFSEWLPDVYRVLKNGTHCYIMINSRNLKDLQVEAEKVGFKFQNLLVWRKSNATPNKYYMQQLEFILMLRKGAARNVNDMGVSNCLSCPNIIGKGKDQHPTAKPIALMEVLIKQSSNVGDVVLDPFAGGGSTLIAAKRLERQYIGFEIDKQYYDMANRRLTQEPQQMDMFN